MSDWVSALLTCAAVAGLIVRVFYAVLALLDRVGHDDTDVGTTSMAEKYAQARAFQSDHMGLLPFVECSEIAPQEFEQDNLE